MHNCWLHGMSTPPASGPHLSLTQHFVDR